jgi:hypothetical protein
MLNGIKKVDDLTIYSTLLYRFGDVLEGGGDRKRSKAACCMENVSLVVVDVVMPLHIIYVDT